MSTLNLEAIKARCTERLLYVRNHTTCPLEISDLVKRTHDDVTTLVTEVERLYARRSND